MEEAEARRARLLALRNQAAAAAASKASSGASVQAADNRPVHQPLAGTIGGHGAVPSVGFYSSMHLPAPTAQMQQSHAGLSSQSWNHMISPSVPSPAYPRPPPPVPSPAFPRPPPPQHLPPHFSNHNPPQPQGSPGMMRQGVAGMMQGSQGNLAGFGAPFGSAGAGTGARGGRGGGGRGRGGHNQNGGSGGCVGGRGYYKSSFVEDPWAALVAANDSKPPKLPRTM